MKFSSLVIVLLALTVCNRLAGENNYGITSVKLLPGYTLTSGMGTDSYTGRIDRKDGLLITFDIGIGAGLAVTKDKKNEFTWFQEQVIDHNEICLGLRKEEGATYLYVTYSANGANFWTKISSPSDVAEALTMILTYKPAN